ncbi:hypothetical protein P4S83_04260 [Aneurinibacillus thermoaerophilus]|uniref:hypothetical protein n=1 Tax=Aneurinibacillus thermoaerophilus TaxID=143495 RepID=UPI002E1FE54F|nr:hypothetical protein [Aneurinibacillus thermoaerophilus]MED0762821.1 hypothetical protein [Aneurinibacillus thermoaerophilus]
MTKQTYIGVHMTQEEKELLEKFAEAIGWSFSELEFYLTKAIAEKMKKEERHTEFLQPSPIN